MRLAIIGTGISGMTAAWMLHREHEITVYEAADRIGGHTHTVDVADGQRTWPVDTGFIVFNDWTYPNFIRLLDLLGVPSRESEMSFSVQCEASGLEYNGTSLDQLFAQRANLLRPGFHRMIRDILRFNKRAPALLDEPEEGMGLTLGQYLDRHGYSREFVEHYLIPMGASIWSADPATFRAFPARMFVRFFHNHGMLSVDERPTWRTIAGGSRSYATVLTAPFMDRIRLGTPVRQITRHTGGATVSAGGRDERYDGVILACHSDTARSLLGDPSREEHEILGALPYQMNDTVLHTDARVLPTRRKCWAAWNYHIPRESRGGVALTYHMNILQGLDAEKQYLVTLNAGDSIDPATIIRRIQYTHPIFTPAGVVAQGRHGEISGMARRTWYCGAYWRYGFHEDGVLSALRVCRDFGWDLDRVAAEKAAPAAQAAQSAEVAR